MRKKIKIDKTLSGEEVRDALSARFPEYEIKAKKDCKKIYVRVSKHGGLEIKKGRKALFLRDWNPSIMSKVVREATEDLLSSEVRRPAKTEVTKFLDEQFSTK